jgi:hypothetical protein
MALTRCVGGRRLGLNDADETGNTGAIPGRPRRCDRALNGRPLLFVHCCSWEKKSRQATRRPGWPKARKSEDLPTRNMAASARDGGCDCLGVGVHVPPTFVVDLSCARCCALRNQGTVPLLPTMQAWRPKATDSLRGCCAACRRRLASRAETSRTWPEPPPTWHAGRPRHAAGSRAENGKSRVES